MVSARYQADMAEVQRRARRHEARSFGGAAVHAGMLSGSSRRIGSVPALAGRSQAPDHRRPAAPDVSDRFRVASPEEVQRRRSRAVRWAWVKREAHWLCFGAAVVAGGMLWGLALYAPPSRPVNVLKVALVLTLAGAGCVALLRALLVDEA